MNNTDKFDMFYFGGVFVVVLVGICAGFYVECQKYKLLAAGADKLTDTVKEIFS